MSANFEIVPEEGDGPLSDAINAGLIAWNDRVTGPARRQRFAYAVKDANGRVAGGITAKLYRDSLYIDDLFLDDAMRGQGIGTRLMDLAEARAREAGCVFVYLDTMDWQARPFYEKRGYRVFHTFSYEGGKFQSFMMRKDL
jgi:GNAT superfamily N-acetyltransferase